MPDGVLINNGGTVVSVVYGFSGTPPNGQTFVAGATQGVVPGQIVSAGTLTSTPGVSTTITITSSSTPSLNGTYACDAATVSSIQKQMTALLNSSFTTFYGGSNTISWPDASGTQHVFTPSQFKAFSVEVSNYLNALYTAAGQIAASMPAPSATIP